MRVLEPVERVSTYESGPPAVRDGERVARLAGLVRKLLVELGLDLEDPNLATTHERVAKMYLEMFRGLDQGTKPRVTTFPNDENYRAMVMEKDIPF